MHVSVQHSTANTDHAQADAEFKTKFLDKMLMMIIMIVIMCLREWILSGFHWLVLTIDWIT